MVRFCTQRGTAEHRIKEGQYAFHWTRLSCKRFRDNEVRLQLHALAYNLANFLRCIELPAAMADWSLTSLQLKLIRCPAGDACIAEKEDRRPRRAPRPRHHLPAGRSCGNRPDGARHPRRHPPPSSTTVMRVTALRTQTERKRQDRSARRAEKRRRRASTARIRGPIQPTRGVCATADTARGGKSLLSGGFGRPFHQAARHSGNVG